jgi:cell division septation protein DedD
MANRRSRDWVLGGRHLAGIFILLVVMFGMVFTLGYLLGRNQYDAQLRAAASILPGRPDSAPERGSDQPSKPGRAAAGNSATKAEKQAPPTDWAFYHSAEPEKPAEPFPETPKSFVPERTASPSTPAVKPISRVDSPRSSLKSVRAPAIPHGAIVLQVAAMARRADAVGLAQALQQKKFPAFVLPPGASRYYRVRVGPYMDQQSADLARQKLESQGFKAITRR